MQDYPKAAKASASVPFVFGPTIFKPEGYDEELIFMDGGVARDTNIDYAIDKCSQMTGGDESKITIDVMIPVATGAVQEILDTENTLQNYFRAKSISAVHRMVRDMNYIRAKYPLVNFRHEIAQGPGYRSLDELNFNGEFTWALQMLGR